MAKPRRKVIDCRLYSGEEGCTLAISGTEEEVLDAAVHHAITRHEHEDTPALRDELRSLLRDA